MPVHTSLTPKLNYHPKDLKLYTSTSVLRTIQNLISTDKIKIGLGKDRCIFVLVVIPWEGEEGEY